MISDILHHISMMKNVAQIYDNNVYIVTKENKRQFSKMLIENPYLHFTNLSIKASINKSRLEDIKNQEKRSIVIIDIEDISNEVIELLSSSNIQILFVSKLGKQIPQSIQEKSIVIHKKDRLKSVEKLVYKTIVSKLSDNNISFEEYFEFINSSIGIKYIVIKDRELRYM
jgi:sugar-specific transcriptional regulator TrmB